MLTEEQQNFKTAVIENPDQSFILQALAGTGKTFTLLQACPTEEAVLALAFNKRIATELGDKFPANAECKTFNGFGHGVWSKYLGRRPEVRTSKLYQITKEVLEEIGEEWAWKVMGDLMNLVNSARNAGIVPKDERRQHIPLAPDDPEIWYAMCDDEDYDTRLIEPAKEILRRSIDQAMVGVIDFADQLYMPVVFRGPWPRGKYPTMIVDEAQDLNPLQHEMVRLTQKKGRIIAAGDRKQAIYGWRGASENSMDELKDMFDAREFPLTVTWRCPKAVVQLARKWAPQYQAAPDAPEGNVCDFGFAWDMHQFPKDSVILCRNNKPLFILAMQMMAAGVSCRMEGRDIGRGLKRIITDLIKSNDEDVNLVLKKVENWANNKKARYLEKADFAKAAKVEDQAASIEAISIQASTAQDILQIIDELFGKNTAKIVLSTIHKAKGLEWKHVHILNSDLIGSRSNTVQEQNLHYVAVTRALETLTYISMDC